MPRRLTFRHIVVTVLLACAAGCNAVGWPGPAELPVFRTEVRPAVALDRGALEAAAETLEGRLRFIGADAGVAARVVDDVDDDFLLLEVPAEDVPAFPAQVLDAGVVSLVGLGDGVRAEAGDVPPAGTVHLAGQGDIDPASVTVVEEAGEPALQFHLREGAAARLARFTADSGRFLALVVDGRIVIVAAAAAPILDGAVSVAGPETRERLPVVGALLASGPLATDLVPSDGQIEFGE